MSNNDKFDSFPVNICESIGEIERRGFNFVCSSYRIWSGGSIILQDKGDFNIYGMVSDGILGVGISSDIFSKFVCESFYFENISTTKDRVLWTKSSQLVSERTASALSLFYKKMVLSRVAITIDSPQVLIEMDGKPTEGLPFINPISKFRDFDLGDILRLDFPDKLIDRCIVYIEDSYYSITAERDRNKTNVVIVDNFVSFREGISSDFIISDNFWKDIESFFCYYQRGDNLYNSFVTCLMGTLGDKIDKTNKLIDADIFITLNELIIFVEAILEGDGLPKLSREGHYHMVNDLMNIVVERFINYIYRTKYKKTFWGKEKMYLEKMI